MSEITFGGLASGMDTESIISALMDVERQPVDRLENDKAYLEAETQAYAEFNTKLANLLGSVEELDTLAELTSYSAISRDESLLRASTDSNATSGNYDIEIISLAEVQKDVSAEGFADTSSQTLNGSLTIGEETIDYADVSLGELKDIINDADTGLKASIIDDGTENGFRLILSSDEAGVTTEISGSGSINLDTATTGHTKAASQAHIVVDNIDIYSNSNTVTNAIPGITLDLLGTNSGESMVLNVDTDTDTVKQKVDDFVSAYNSIVNWIDEQADADWGNDSAISSVQRKMQNLLTTQQNGNDSLNSLIQLGFKTDYTTGTISYSSSLLTDAIAEDINGFTQLFTGDNENDGIMDMFVDYFDQQSDSIDGVYAQRKESNDSSIRRIDDNIATMELRLVQRETTLRSQYTAMEELISGMNAQMSYLSAISGS